MFAKLSNSGCSRHRARPHGERPAGVNCCASGHSTFDPILCHPARIKAAIEGSNPGGLPRCSTVAYPEAARRSTTRRDRPSARQRPAGSNADTRIRILPAIGWCQKPGPTAGFSGKADARQRNRIHLAQRRQIHWACRPDAIGQRGTPTVRWAGGFANPRVISQWAPNVAAARVGLNFCSSPPRKTEL